MSLINRVATTNLSNLNYPDTNPKNWSPRYRYQVLDFHGQSAAINLVNGGGKTTLAEGILALLSRDRKLLKSTREKFSTRTTGLMTHIQVEFIVSKGDSSQSDILVNLGEEKNGELWVFGMCGHSGAQQSLTYYLYKGSLDDLPIGKRDGHQITLTSDKDFMARRKEMSDVLTWNLPKTEWDEQVKNHISSNALKQLVNYQKGGGDDTSAQLYNFKSKPGERYSVSFFYEVLAPQIMSGIMGAESEEDEEYLEDTLDKTIMSVVKASRKTAKKEKTITTYKDASNKLQKVADKSQTAQKDHKKYNNKLSEVSLDVTVLSDIVDKGLLLGLPKTHLPDGLAGKVAKEVIIKPGETEFRITNTGLAHLLGIETKRVTESAKRASVFGRKLTQVIDIACDLKEPNDNKVGEKRYESTSYNKSEVKKILSAANTFAQNMELSEVTEILDEVDHWFTKTSDTNPYRQILIEKNVDKEYYKQQYLDKKEEHQRLIDEREALRKQKREFKDNESFYNDILNSKLFTEQELRFPLETQIKVSEEQKKYTDEFNAFQKKEASLEAFIESWDDYTQLHDEVDPNIIEKSYLLKYDKAQKQYDKTNTDRNILIADKTTASDMFNTKKNESTALAIQLKQFEKLQPSVEHFNSKFDEGTDPEGLDTKLIIEHSRLQNINENLPDQIKKYQTYQDAITSFEKEIEGKQPPSQWLVDVEQERVALTSTLNNHKLDEKDYLRQLNALDNESVAATKEVQTALDRFDTLGLDYKTVHEIIMNLDVDKDRRSALLSSFSLVLFSPVFNELDHAYKAIESLDNNHASLAIYTEESLNKYLEGEGSNTDIHSDNYPSTLYVGIHVGIPTRQVECLLDPKLVEKEKKDLQGKLDVIRDKVDTLKERASVISSEGDLVTLARMAMKAIEDNVIDLLEEANKEYATNEKEIERLALLTNSVTIQSIKKAQEFNEIGGESAYDSKKVQQKTLIEETAELQSNLGSLESQLVSVQSLLTTHQEDLENSYTQETRNMIHDCKKFWVKDGLNFTKNKESNQVTITGNLEKANERYRYDTSFVRIAAYVELIVKEKNTKSLEKEIDQLGTKITDAKKASITAFNEQLKIEETEIPNLKTLVKSIDSSAQKILEKYKKIAVLKNDVADIGVDQEDIESHLVWTACSNVNFVDEYTQEDIDDIKNQSDQLDDAVDSINIDDHLNVIKRYRRDYMASEKEFIDSSINLSKDDSVFGPSELAKLENVKSVTQAEAIKSFNTKFKAVLTKSEKEFEQLKESEKGVRKGLSTNTALMITHAAQDLDTLKRVVRKDYNDIKSHFVVNASVITKEEAKTLVDELVAFVDHDEKHREESLKKGITQKDDESYKSNRKTVIREKIYRSIFKDPSVKFVNEKIRADSKEHDLDEGTSQGEKAGLSLMWTIRLSEFVIEKEAKRSHSASARRKIRNRSESIIIVDGLFSNLSDRALIKSVMSGMEDTRGRFQLIGFMHHPSYENDFKVFPVFIVGKKNNASGKGNGWVSFSNGKPVPHKHDQEVNFAKLVRTPPPTSNTQSH